MKNEVNKEQLGANKISRAKCKIVKPVDFYIGAEHPSGWVTSGGINPVECYHGRS